MVLSRLTTNCRRVQVVCGQLQVLFAEEVLMLDLHCFSYFIMVFFLVVHCVVGNWQHCLILYCVSFK